MSVPRPRAQIQPVMPLHPPLSTPRLPLEGRAEEGILEKGNSYTLDIWALVQLNGGIFLFYNKSLGDLNVEKFPH